MSQASSFRPGINKKELALRKSVRDTSKIENCVIGGLNYACTLAGAYKNEFHDCSVRALSVASGLPYRLCYSMLKNLVGRNKFERTPPFSLIIPKLPLKFQCVTTRHYRLRTFIKKHPTGRFLIETHQHATALVDGVIHDWDYLTPGTFVESSWKIVGLKKGV